MLRLRFYPPHTHPLLLAGPYTPPPSSLFLCSTGPLKVSQFPVALLYRLQCIFFKYAMLSLWCKECPCRPSCSSAAPSFFSYVLNHTGWLSGSQLSLAVTRQRICCCLSHKSKTEKKESTERLGGFSGSCQQNVLKNSFTRAVRGEKNRQQHSECFCGALSRNYKWMHLITSIFFWNTVHLQLFSVFSVLRDNLVRAYVFMWVFV